MYYIFVCVRIVTATLLAVFMFKRHSKVVNSQFEDAVIFVMNRRHLYYITIGGVS
jgi:hypothetical protein